ncbi:MAG: hypothetical protein RL419_1220 [Actinomycetota bacterium]|jgi:3-oxoacyl-[acyl-carrier protein] reductase
MDRRLQDRFALEGQVAVVTGAAMGMGRETTLTLARAGARVVGIDRNADVMEETRSIALAEGLECSFAVADVSSRDDMMKIARRTKDDLGRVDGWANIAGILRYSLIEDVTPDHVNEVIAVNQLGVLWGIAAAASVMMNGGSIVNIASSGGEMPYPSLAAYGMTKAAVMQLTRTAALELGEKGIRVNAIAPGFVDTPMVRNTHLRADGTLDEDKRREHLAARAAQSPLGLTGEVQDMAMTILFLMSEAGRFYTGQVLRPNGGVFFG